MNPRLLSLALLPVLMHLHLRITMAGSAVTLSMSWVIPAAILAALAVLVVVCVRSARGFKSSPYPRMVTNWST